MERIDRPDPAQYAAEWLAATGEEAVIEVTGPAAEVTPRRALEPRPGQPELTDLERDALWWRLMKGLAATHNELELLEQCPPHVRTMIYGPGVLKQFQGTRDDLADLIDHDLAGQAPVMELVLGGRRPGLYINGNKV